jgi:hypothetical protein
MNHLIMLTLNKKFSRRGMALLGLLLVACAEPDLGPTPEPGDYYPTTKGLEWRYLMVDHFSTHTRVPVLTTRADTVIGNRTYTRLAEVTDIGNGMADEALSYVRKENGNYIKLNISHFSAMEGDTVEMVFLKDNLRPGATWEQVPDRRGVYRSVYTVVAIHGERKIEGRTYGNTIEIREDRYCKFAGEKEELYATARSIYAKDAGLVFEETENLGYYVYGKKVLKMGPSPR